MLFGRSVGVQRDPSEGSRLPVAAHELSLALAGEVAEMDRRGEREMDLRGERDGSDSKDFEWVRGTGRGFYIVLHLYI